MRHKPTVLIFCRSAGGKMGCSDLGPALFSCLPVVSAGRQVFHFCVFDVTLFCGIGFQASIFCVGFAYKEFAKFFVF